MPRPPQREAPWCKVPLRLLLDPEVTVTIVQVFGYIDHRAGKRGHWYGQQAEIGEGTELAPRTIKFAVRWLRERNFIATERLGAADNTMLRYYILSDTIDITEGHDDAPRTDDRSAPLIPTEVHGDALLTYSGSQHSLQHHSGTRARGETEQSESDSEPETEASSGRTRGRGTTAGAGVDAGADGRGGLATGGEGRDGLRPAAKYEAAHEPGPPRAAQIRTHEDVERYLKRGRGT